jgi:positive regulator of sigma E activity
MKNNLTAVFIFASISLICAVLAFYLIFNTDDQIWQSCTLVVLAALWGFLAAFSYKKHRERQQLSKLPPYYDEDDDYPSHQ